MSRRFAVLTLALGLLSPRAARGQDGSWETVRSDAEHFFDDVLHVWTSPFRVSGDAVPGLIALTGTVFAVGLNDGAIQAWIDTHPNALPVRALAPFRHPRPLSQLGFTHTLVPLSVALYGAGLLLDSDAVREAGIGCLTSDVANTLARHALARLLGRLRPQFTDDPYVIRPFAFGDWPLRSFPGGHAANIMACTAFWNNRFDLGAAGPALYLLGVGIGLGRTVDGAHWASDTLFGFVFGWAVGRAVADRFLERAHERDRDSGRSTLRQPPVLHLGWRIPMGG